MAVKTAVGKTTKSSDFVTIPRIEYETLLGLKKAESKSHYLTGKAAKRLDKLVNDGLKEYKSGKTESLDSFLKREYPCLYKRYAN